MYDHDDEMDITISHSNQYNGINKYILILLSNDNIIVGRYGKGKNVLNYYYHNAKKKVPFGELESPYKRLTCG